MGKYVRHLEKIIIIVILLMVLIYTVNIDRNPQNFKQKPPIPPPSSENEKSFFPVSDPSPEDESIIEETFTEVP